MPPRGRLYHEFLRVPDLSAGLYVLDAGATDPQSPHTEDELYYVVAGRGMVSVGGETRPIVPGSLVFVAAHVAHRFHDIAERLELLVVFGPAEGDARLTPLPPDRPQADGVPTRRSTASPSARASSAPRPTSSWRKNANTSSPAARNGSSRAAQPSSSSGP